MIHGLHSLSRWPLSFPFPSRSLCFRNTCLLTAPALWPGTDCSLCWNVLPQPFTRRTALPSKKLKYSPWGLLWQPYLQLQSAPLSVQTPNSPVGAARQGLDPRSAPYQPHDLGVSYLHLLSIPSSSVKWDKYFLPIGLPHRAYEVSFIARCQIWPKVSIQYRLAPVRGLMGRRGARLAFEN